jgi:hypothetical protein
VKSARNGSENAFIIDVEIKIATFEYFFTVWTLSWNTGTTLQVILSDGDVYTDIPTMRAGILSLWASEHLVMFHTQALKQITTKFTPYFLIEAPFHLVFSGWCLI